MENNIETMLVNMDVKTIKAETKIENILAEADVDYEQKYDEASKKLDSDDLATLNATIFLNYLKKNGTKTAVLCCE